MRPGCGSDQPPWPLPSLSQAKLGDEILDYRDLAALPKSKAIYNIDRPDMISYAPYISHSVGDRQSYSEVWATQRIALAASASLAPSTTRASSAESPRVLWPQTAPRVWTGSPLGVGGGRRKL